MLLEKLHCISLYTIYGYTYFLHWFIACGFTGPVALTIVLPYGASQQPLHPLRSRGAHGLRGRMAKISFYFLTSLNPCSGYVMFRFTLLRIKFSIWTAHGSGAACRLGHSVHWVTGSKDLELGLRQAGRRIRLKEKSGHQIWVGMRRILPYF